MGGRGGGDFQVLDVILGGLNEVMEGRLSERGECRVKGAYGEGERTREEHHSHIQDGHRF